MLRLRALRPTNEKIAKVQLHPTHPWLVTADASDHVSVWNWEHRQVIYELKAGGVDQRRLLGAKLEKLAEGEAEPRGKRAEALRGGRLAFMMMMYTIGNFGTTGLLLLKLHRLSKISLALLVPLPLNKRATFSSDML
ncbi:UNVERIFIED_CONTAM: hypothetical protein Sangu_0591000 [Sesamum angustifolium]|uniref:Uncharacterized protein n=1 Tax=Sesamum angustifolium TaxID=2727405 RepID=A0AAW2QAY1_9LAMI